MILINNSLLKDLSNQARENNRLRQNLNLHQSYEEPSQRLLNAMEPGSYIRPHRHLCPPKPESFLAIKGALAFIKFTNEGQIEAIVIFGPEEEVVGVDIPPGIWHTVVSLETGSIFYETKPGPYKPIPKHDMAPWAPEESSDSAILYIQGLTQACKERSTMP